MIYPGEPPHVVDCPALRWDGEEVYCLETKTGDTDCWHDLCPYETGAWGAWRAVGREVSWRAEVISEMAREYDTDRLNLGALFVSLGMYIEIRIYLDASGWSL